jgi:phosphoserine aminotransferase
MPYREGDILLTDASSNFLSRPIDWKRISLAYAHTQKNCGISGSTIMIIDEKLVNMPHLEKTPLVCDYKQYKQGYPSTPIVIPIYMNRLLLKYVKDQGGPTYFE